MGRIQFCGKLLKKKKVKLERLSLNLVFYFIKQKAMVVSPARYKYKYGKAKVCYFIAKGQDHVIEHIKAQRGGQGL